MNLSRMDLDDCGGNPKKIVEGIFDQLPELIFPVPVRDIALALDINEIAALTTSGYVGGLVIGNGSGVILVNQNDTEQRQRFTIGHELGHFLIPWHTLNSDAVFNCTSEQMALTDTKAKEGYLRKEAEANCFSAELLMPRAHFISDMRKAGEPSLDSLFAIANKYDVSKEACARRFTELNDEPCAIIHSKDGVVRYYNKHPDFPYLDVKKGLPIPKSALSSDPKIKAGETTESIEVDTDTWISSDRQPVPGSLIEQTSKFGDGYQMTILFAGEDEEADEDEYDEPHFR